MSANDLIVLTTPIYTWFGIAPVKALEDRAICADNKNYGKVRGTMLAGKEVVTLDIHQRRETMISGRQG